MKIQKITWWTVLAISGAATLFVVADYFFLELIEIKLKQRIVLFFFFLTVAALSAFSASDNGIAHRLRMAFLGLIAIGSIVLFAIKNPFANTKNETSNVAALAQKRTATTPDPAVAVARETIDSMGTVKKGANSGNGLAIQKKNDEKRIPSSHSRSAFFSEYFDFLPLIFLIVAVPFGATLIYGMIRKRGNGNGIRRKYPRTIFWTLVLLSAVLSVGTKHAIIFVRLSSLEKKNIEERTQRKMRAEFEKNLTVEKVVIYDTLGTSAIDSLEDKTQRAFSEILRRYDSLRTEHDAMKASAIATMSDSLRIAQGAVEVFKKSLEEQANEQLAQSNSVPAVRKRSIRTHPTQSVTMEKEGPRGAKTLRELQSNISERRARRTH